MVERERETRRRRIDPRLQAAKWECVPYRVDVGLDAHRRAAVEEYPTATGPADYVLCDDGLALGVVEAKRQAVGPRSVLTQAERYARGFPDGTLDFDGYRVPFLYSTNGEVIHFRDARHPRNRSRPVVGFHTPAALRDLLDRDFDAACERLRRAPVDERYLRPYQVEAIGEIERRIADRVRAMLVPMATGTGKTRVAVAQVERLLRSGVARRVLFLVDRRALAAQAVQTFRSYEAEPGLKFHQVYELYSQRFQQGDLAEGETFDPTVLPEGHLTDPRPGTTYVYVCTIQRMARYLFGARAAVLTDDPDGNPSGDEPPEEDADRLDIPIHAFDVVIADECHRGYTAQETSVWRDTLDHFDAIRIGLTATPAPHTMAYFGEAAFRYPYERAVQEGHLVDYDAVSVTSDVRLQGVFLREGEFVDMVDPETGERATSQIEDERHFTANEVERAVTSPDSNRRIVQEIRQYVQEHERRYGRFPKTLVFAANDLPHTSHADQLVDTFRDVFGLGEGFVRKITGRVDRPLQAIREFRNRPDPHVVVTVDLLSTGVDVPDIEFIVFLRPVRSRILFEQMMGRGTRRGERHPDKANFVVFDCFGGTLLRRFRQATGVTLDRPVRATRPIADVIEDVWQNRDRAYNVRCLVKRLQRIDRSMGGDARELFSAFLPAGDVGAFAAALPDRLAADFTGTMTLLRDPDFQRLLVDHPRAPRSFLVASEHHDRVDSGWLIRAGTGGEHRPDDYLRAFARFVREHADDVRAIRIVLDQPGKWSTEVLRELRDALLGAPERFSDERLQHAHRAVHDKPLVDLISAVRHAVAATSPLLTAGERVAEAVRRVTDGHDLTDEQRTWMDRIEGRLHTDLSIGRDDFDDMPELARHGGWSRADRAFGGRLDGWLADLNTAVAAAGTGAVDATPAGGRLAGGSHRASTGRP